jgi:flagellar biosynthesis/type III secretory pathway ATPase
MGSETELVLGLWETFKDVVPASKREDTANKMLKILEDWVDLEEVGKELHGEDKYLDQAFSSYVEVDNDFDDSDDEEY